MNLLEEAFLPVRRHDGTRLRIRPCELSDPALAAFDAERADFNGALAQFAIGLLQTATPVNSPGEWYRLYKTPPDEATLRAWFEPHGAAFEFDGDGARFMQDFSLRADDGEPVAIGSLLIESPGENALRNNGDHFVKRGQVRGMCPHCAALALFTLQLNAPAGGAGHRTGLRGGGPLTTLLTTQSQPDQPRSLWHSLWLNVRERDVFLAGGGDTGKTAPLFTFPWLADIGLIQKEGGETAPVQVHPAHVLWAMPRRIRLDFEHTATGDCDLCGRRADWLLTKYVTRNYGLNYKGAWNHPLSPYYEAKDGWLPLHPQPGGLGWRHWLGWVLGMRSDKKALRRAATVEYALGGLRGQRLPDTLRLWVFGYDMDNMKARCWYEATLPLYHLGECDPSEHKPLRDEVGEWIAGAELAASCLRGAVKDAWFSHEARGDFSIVDASFWSRTEPLFYAQLRRRIELARSGGDPDRLATAERWLADLARIALALFEGEFVGTGPVQRQNPARVAQAQRQLKRNLHGPKLRAALGLPIPEKTPAKSGKTRSKAA